MLRPHIHLPPPRAVVGETTGIVRARTAPDPTALTQLLRAAGQLPAERNVGVPDARPARCCVHCGHGLYVPPKATRVRCPVCTRELDVLDIVLTGDVARAEPIVTAGKITVAVGSRVAGDLVACSIEVGGKLLGDSLASYGCRICCTAHVSGDVICRHLTLEPGAQVTGNIEVITG